MKILFIGGIFDDVHYPEITEKTKTHVEYSANNFQKKLLEGLALSGVNPIVVSAPFIGAYPQAYSESFFKGFSNPDNSGYHYCSFCNLFGLRNVSRRKSVIRAIKPFIEEEDAKKVILVYSPHTPFLEAANYAKKKDPRISVCLIVPDLPQYMNLDDKIPWYYRVLKKIDIHLFLKLNQIVDSYVLLTEQMKYFLDVGNRPYIVVEGIGKDKPCDICDRSTDYQTIVYTGKLNYSFGIMTLVEAFSRITNPNLHLIICGGGEAKTEIEKAAIKDNRIQFKGQVTPAEAISIIRKAAVLVNPRQNNSEYTKYSFPSKLIDYLSTGKPVVAYRLDGMPDFYNSILYCPPDNSVEALKNQIELALSEDESYARQRVSKYVQYFNETVSEESVGRRIETLIS